MGIEQEVIKTTVCKRCGRKLRSKEAIEIGMGKVCWYKYQKENNHRRLWDNEKMGVK